MNTLLRHRPSPAMVVALIALFVALGGAGYAAIKLPANSVGTKQLKKNAVRRSKIAAKAVNGSKVAADSLTGANILESSLGPVPAATNATNATHATSADSATNASNATHATSADSATSATHATNADHATSADSATNASAVGGLAVVKFSRSGAVPFGSPATVLSLAGLRLEYACTPNFPDSLTFSARTTVDDARIWLARNFFGGATIEADTSFNTGETFSLIGFVGTGVYTAPGGTVVTFTYRNTLNCADGVAGTAYGG